jgi:hypothetical protein
MEISYPSKSRSVKVGASFPGKSDSVEVGAKSGRKLASRKGNDGKKPSKGVLLKGGGHG